MLQVREQKFSDINNNALELSQITRDLKNRKKSSTLLLPKMNMLDKQKSERINTKDLETDKKKFKTKIQREFELLRQISNGMKRKQEIWRIKIDDEYVQQQVDEELVSSDEESVNEQLEIKQKLD